MCCASVERLTRNWILFIEFGFIFIIVTIFLTSSQSAKLIENGAFCPLGATNGDEKGVRGKIEPHHVLEGTVENGRFGHSVLVLDSKILISAPYADKERGYIYEYSKETLGLLEEPWRGREKGANFGYSMVSLTDFNEDGYSEFAISQTSASSGGIDRGRVDIYDGKIFNVLSTAIGKKDYDYFGRGMSFLNGAQPKLVIGVPDTHIGGARIFKITPEIKLLEVGKIERDKIEGEEPFERLGSEVITVGDTDGIPYFILAAPGDHGQMDVSFEGNAYLYSGSTYKEIAAFSGDEGKGGRLSFSLSPYGKRGFIFGEPYYHPTSLPIDERLRALGVAKIYRTKEELQYRYEGNRDFGRLGISVAELGDVNKDAISDFAIGVPGLWKESGATCVYSGKNGALLYELSTGDQYDSHAKVFGIGDIDNNGKNDLLVASPVWNIIGDCPFCGKVYVYLFD